MTTTYVAPDGVAITAQQYRQANAAQYGGGSGRPLGGRSGFRVDTPSNILTATSTTWTLGPCVAQIDPGASTHQGMYGWASDANITGSVTAADATNARKDIVYIQVNDSSAGDGSGATTANPAYLAGVASTTPVAPALPARSFLVGTIDVPKAGAGAPTVTLNPARFVAAGGTLPVYSQTERDGLVKYDGLAVRRMDLPGRPVETWDGAVWFLDRTVRRKFVPGTASGSLPTASGWIPIAADYTVAAAPFGAGVPYEIDVEAQAAPTAGAGGAVAMRVQFNAAAADGGQAQTPTSSSGTLLMKGSKYVTDGSAVTVSVQVTALTAAATLSSGNSIYWYKVLVRPVTNL